MFHLFSHAKAFLGEDASVNSVTTDLSNSTPPTLLDSAVVPPPAPVQPDVQISENVPENNATEMGELQKEMDFGNPVSQQNWESTPAGEFKKGGSFKEAINTATHKIGEAITHTKEAVSHKVDEVEKKIAIEVIEKKKHQKGISNSELLMLKRVQKLIHDKTK